MNFITFHSTLDTIQTQIKHWIFLRTSCLRPEIPFIIILIYKLIERKRSKYQILCIAHSNWLRDRNHKQCGINSISRDRCFIFLFRSSAIPISSYKCRQYSNEQNVCRSPVSDIIHSMRVNWFGPIYGFVILFNHTNWDVVGPFNAKPQSLIG